MLFSNAFHPTSQPRCPCRRSPPLWGTDPLALLEGKEASNKSVGIIVESQKWTCREDIFIIVLFSSIQPARAGRAPEDAWQASHAGSSSVSSGWVDSFFFFGFHLPPPLAHLCLTTC